MFFSEVRYHLAVAPLLFPFSANAAGWLADATRRRFRGEARTALMAAAAVLAVVGFFVVLFSAGRALLEGHRWAVAVCRYPTSHETQLCSWRRVLPRGGVSPLRGTWDGVGLRAVASRADDVLASARTSIPVAAGRVRVSAKVSVSAASAAPAGALTIAVRSGGVVVARTLSPAFSGSPGPSAPPAILEGVMDHPGGPLSLEVELEPGGSGSLSDGTTAWISDLVVERSPGLGIIPPR